MSLSTKTGFMPIVAPRCGDKMYSPLKLNICMLLYKCYDPDMPARPAVREIYGNCFPNMGHKVTWIMPAQTSQKEIQGVPFGDVRIFTIPYHTSSFLPKKVFAQLVFLWKEVKLASRVIRREGCNIIQVRNGVFEGLLSIYLKRKYEIPFIFQYSFPLTEESLTKYDPSLGKFFYLMGKFQRLVLPFIMHKADLIFPISERMMEDLVNNGIPKAKMMPLPLGVNTELFSPAVAGDRIRTRYDLSNSKVIVYLGTMDKLRQSDILMHSMARLKPDRQDVKLLMVGDGNDRANLEKLAHNLGLGDDIIFTGQVPYFEVPQFIAAADIGLSPVPPLDIFKVSSPCKLFEYMAMARPVMANEEIPEHKEVLEQSRGGVLVPFTPEAFAGAIIELLDNPKKAAETGRRGREWVVKNRSYEILAREVEKRYFELLHGRELSHDK